MEKLAYSVSELGQALGIGRTAAYQLVHQAGFPAVRIMGRIVVPVDALRSWMEAGGTEPREEA